MKTRQCCMCKREGSLDEIKSVGSHCNDDIQNGVNAEYTIARRSVRSYGYEYPEKMFCRECFEKLENIFS